MKDDLVRQIEMRSLETGLRTICWIDNDKGIKKGAIISLAGSDEKFEVLEKYNSIVQRATLHKDWKVGGLK